MSPLIFLDLPTFTNMIAKVHVCPQESTATIDLASFDKHPAMLDFLCCKKQIALDHFTIVHSLSDVHSYVQALSNDCNFMEDKILYINEHLDCNVSITSTEIGTIILKQDTLAVPEQTQSDVLVDPLGFDKCETKCASLPPVKLPKIISISTTGIETLDEEDMQRKKYPDMLFCEYCGEKFTGKDRAYKFSYHRNKVHTQVLSYPCQYCQKIYWGERELNTHLLSHSSPGYICHICGKSWNSKTEIARHILVHGGNKTFICSFCGVKFRRKDHLNIHIRKHTGDMPYRCKSCGSGYPQKRQLELHTKKCKFSAVSTSKNS